MPAYQPVGSRALSDANGHAAGTAALLSLLFLVVYGGTNWIATARGEFGRLGFEWEQQIPFLWWMLIPYLSLGLFFLGAPFICVDRAERRVLAQRIAFSILAAAVFFVMLPVELSFPVRHSSTWFDFGLAIIDVIDPPHNLFPSLHVAFGVILAAHFMRHSHGALRAGVTLWFLVLTASTVLTHRHHVVDLLGGAALGVLAIYLFRERRNLQIIALDLVSSVREPRLAVTYGLGCAACATLSALAWPWSAVLLWPALALGIVACGYGGLGPCVFRKSQGRVSISARIVLAPVLIGHRLSWLWYSKQSQPWDEVIPGLWIGRSLRSTEAQQARGDGLTAVLDLTAEASAPEPFQELHYRNLQIMDLTAPSAGQIDAANAFIEERAMKGTILVHCKAGYSRSAAIVGAYLIASGHCASAEQAIARLREVRPRIVIRPEARAAIDAFVRRRNGRYA